MRTGPRPYHLLLLLALAYYYALRHRTPRSPCTSDVLLVFPPTIAADAHPQPRDVAAAHGVPPPPAGEQPVRRGHSTCEEGLAGAGQAVGAPGASWNEWVVQAAGKRPPSLMCRAGSRVPCSGKGGPGEPGCRKLHINTHIQTHKHTHTHALHTLQVTAPQHVVVYSEVEEVGQQGSTPGKSPGKSPRGKEVGRCLVVLNDSSELVWLCLGSSSASTCV